MSFALLGILAIWVNCVFACLTVWTAPTAKFRPLHTWEEEWEMTTIHSMIRRLSWCWVGLAISGIGAVIFQSGIGLATSSVVLVASTVLWFYSFSLYAISVSVVARTLPVRAWDRLSGLSENEQGFWCTMMSWSLHSFHPIGIPNELHWGPIYERIYRDGFSRPKLRERDREKERRDKEHMRFWAKTLGHPIEEHMLDNGPKPPTLDELREKELQHRFEWSIPYKYSGLAAKVTQHQLWVRRGVLTFFPLVGIVATAFVLTT